MSTTNLLTSLCGDPDLSSVARDIMFFRRLSVLGVTMYTVLLVMVRQLFKEYFFQHAQFINTTSIVTLADTCGPSQESGFLSFV